jgi:hypothetical protein
VFSARYNSARLIESNFAAKAGKSALQTILYKHRAATSDKPAKSPRSMKVGCGWPIQADFGSRRVSFHVLRKEIPHSKDRTRVGNRSAPREWRLCGNLARTPGLVRRPHVREFREQIFMRTYLVVRHFSIAEDRKEETYDIIDERPPIVREDCRPRRIILKDIRQQRPSHPRASAGVYPPVCSSACANTGTNWASSFGSAPR